MESGQIITLLILGGIVYLIYKVISLYGQREELKKQRSDDAAAMKKAADDIDDIAKITNNNIADLLYRQASAYATMRAVFKKTTATYSSHERQKIAHKIARDTVVAVSKYPALGFISTNDQKIGYYDVLFPGIISKINTYDMDIDSKEVVSAIEEYLMKMK